MVTGKFRGPGCIRKTCLPLAGIFFLLTSCSGGQGFGRSSSKAVLTFGAKEKPGKADPGKNAEQGKEEESEDFEKASSPSNVSGSYLTDIKTDCRPAAMAGSDKEKIEASPSLTVRCRYLKSDDAPLKAKFLEGKVTVTMAGGEKKDPKVDASAAQLELGEAESQFEISGYDWLRIEKIEQLSAVFEDSATGKIVTLEKPLVAKMEPEGTILGLRGQVYPMPSEISKINPFSDISNVTSLGVVKFPPWQISKTFKNPNLLKDEEQLTVEETAELNEEMQETSQDNDALVNVVPAKNEENVKLAPLQSFVDGEKIAGSEKQESFAVHLSGILDIPLSGKIKFKISAKTAARVYIEDKEILGTTLSGQGSGGILANFIIGLISRWKINTNTSEIELTAGPKPIRIEYVHGKDEAYPLLLLRWKLPGEKSTRLVPYWALHQ